MNTLKLSTLLATTTIVAASCTAPMEKSTRSEKSDDPNVIFILIDDLSYFGVSAYGVESVTAKVDGKSVVDTLTTPNIDRLAREGVMCTHAYTHALSEATRIALMTGMNNGRNFVHCKALHESQITFADVFKQNGYATGMYGKWKQSRGTTKEPGEKYISKFGWDDYACFDVLGEYQRYVNPYLVVNDVITNYNNRTDVDPRTGRKWFGPDIFNYKALDFIEANKDNPFFLYYPMALIHSEFRPMPDSKPDGAFEEATEKEHTGKNYSNYYTDMIRYADMMIGRVVDKVNELGLRENTLIVVMGDNGSQGFQFSMKDGSVHYGNKGGTNYSGEQVPLIFSMPGTIATAGDEGDKMRKYDGMTDLTDMYPTIFAAAGIDMPNAEDIDGVSMWPALLDESISTHRENDIVYKWYNGNDRMDQSRRLMRYAHNKYYKYYAPHDIYKKGRFFDLTADPMERVGPKGNHINFNHYWYDGLDVDNLNDEQQAAFDMLKAVVDKNEYTAVESFKIVGAKPTMKVGEMITLKKELVPANPTLNNVVWVSSDPSIAKINKFGELTALKAGKVTISLYTWDKSRPIATGSQDGGFNKKSEHQSVNINIE